LGRFSGKKDGLVSFGTSRDARRLKEEKWEDLMGWWRKKAVRCGMQPHMMPTFISMILRLLVSLAPR